MKRILLIDDDHAVRQELAILLRSAGYEALEVTSFDDVCSQMTASQADLILLDISLPGENGEMLLNEYRKSSSTPVIMLTSRTSELDEVISMSCGADDYITKPYNPTILLLRISAVLRRSDNLGSVQKYGRIDFDISSGCLKSSEGEQILTKNETILFRVMLERRGEIVSRDLLMTALWDSDEFVSDNALSVNMSRLRSKLALLGEENAIETRKKQGYLLR